MHFKKLQSKCNKRTALKYVQIDKKANLSQKVNSFYIVSSKVDKGKICQQPSMAYNNVSKQRSAWLLFACCPKQKVVSFMTDIIASHTRLVILCETSEYCCSLLTVKHITSRHDGCPNVFYLVLQYWGPSYISLHSL